jgi:membrane protein
MAKGANKALFAGYWRAFVERLWAAADIEASPVRKAALAAGRVLYIAVEGFADDLCLIRASALAFTSLLALVPTLALVFAALRGLGWHGERLEALILSRATVLSPEAIETVVHYIDNTNFAGLGVIGGCLLFFTFLSVMANIEHAFNAIWGHATPRLLMRRITDYFGVMIVTSVLLGIAASVPAVIASAPLAVTLEARWGVVTALERTTGLGAYVLVCVGFAFLYVFMPNTRVRLIPALAGGVFAGSVWQATQWAYVWFQAGVGAYNAIYGALAQLPVLMAWFFLSWVIVLFGAETAYAVQNLHAYGRDRETRRRAGRGLEDYVAIAVCAELANASAGRSAPSTADDLAERLAVSPRLLGDILERLQHAGLVHRSEDHRGSWFLSFAPQNVAVSRILATFEGAFADAPLVASAQTSGPVLRLLAASARSRAEAFPHCTLLDLIDSPGDRTSSSPTTL